MIPLSQKLKTPKSVHIWIYRKTEEGHLYIFIDHDL
jgi:hypothetical protein